MHNATKVLATDAPIWLISRNIREEYICIDLSAIGGNVGQTNSTAVTQTAKSTIARSTSRIPEARSHAHV